MSLKPQADREGMEPDVLMAEALSRAIGSTGHPSFQFLVDHLPEFIWCASANGLCNYCNRSMREYLADGSAAAQGLEWWNRIHRDDSPCIRALWETAVQNGEPFEAEFRLLRGCDDTGRWFLARATPHRGAEGQLLGWFGACTDIDNQKQAETALRQAKEQSDQNGRVKDEFLSILSHELRTPLSAILGWTQLLEMDALDPKETVEAVQIIKQQAKLQSQLIEDLLEVSRMINGKFHMRRQVLELAPVMQSSVEAHRAAAEARKVAIQFIPCNTPLIVEGDPQRLQQLASNLLTNAIKFSSEGGTVTVRLDRQQSEARLTVSDTGRGIPSDQLGAIFDRFKQLHNGAARPHGGLGLGLSIARHIVERHGGAITAESAGADQGSTFTVLLPIAAVQPQDPATYHHNPHDDTPPQLDGVEILVVDDEESARTIVAACLRKFGAIVQTAPGVLEAWDLLTTHSYRVLISDMSMSVHDGFDLIRRVRQSSQAFNAMPAIALTGFASVDDQTRALDAGFDVHVTKPVDQMELVRCVLALTRQSSTKC